MATLTESVSTSLPQIVHNMPVLIQNVPEAASAIDVKREISLRRLLDGPQTGGPSFGNFEYARDSGLLDLFVYNNETDEDAIMHLLAGGEQVENGATITGGFHHEPSAFYGNDHSGRTYVDRSHLDSLNHKKRVEYNATPFEPYKAKTVIAGRRKITAQTNPKTGGKELVEAKSGMFPQEYDGMAVLQAVRLAYENRDPADDEVLPNGYKAGHGYAPMIDGESLMKIRLIIECETNKVASAFPIVKVGGIMKLSDQAIEKCLGVS